MYKLYRCTAVLASLLCAYAQDEPRHVYKARVVLKGAPGSGISGIVTFTQTRTAFLSEVTIEAQVVGLHNGARHGMHIHEAGSCSDVNPVTGASGAFLGAGGHFDPGPNGNSNADANHPFHMGDIPNLVVNEAGIGTLKHRTSRITLSPGPLSLFDDNGSAVILHADSDQGTTGVAGGAGGARIACGVIELVVKEEKQ